MDFDLTIVHHAYPKVGERVPYALKYLRLFNALNAKLILYTVRDKVPLKEAVQFLTNQGIELYGVNDNPQQKTWSSSRKIYCDLYIDDAAFGCPLIKIEGHERPVADWRIIGPNVLTRLEELNAAKQKLRKKNSTL